MRKLLALIVAPLCFACVGPQSTYTPTIQNISRPAVGAVHSVAVGEEMLAQGTVAEMEGIELPSENRISRYTLSAGFYQMSEDDGQETFHSFRSV
jgi:hypothetical protein